MRPGGRPLRLQLEPKASTSLFSGTEPSVLAGSGVHGVRPVIWLSPARRAHLLTWCEGSQLLDLSGLVVAAPSA